MELHELLNGYGTPREATATVNGHPITVEFVGERITAAALARLEQARATSDGLAVAAAAVLLLSDSLTRWGVERGGVEVPITVEELEKLPAMMLLEIANSLEEAATVPLGTPMPSVNGASQPETSESLPLGGA